MSAFDTAALPGRIPTSGDNQGISPSALFRTKSERDAYKRIVSGDSVDSGLKIDKVKVEIFDLSDETQRRKYEKLWAKLLVKVSNMEAVVETSKDLVHRPDGTSYWMKYVEYVEFGDSKNNRSERK